MGKRIKKTPEKKDVDAQMAPEIIEVAVVASPLLMVVLTAMFRSVISFFTWRWLEYLFPK